jgi:uncharacterized repeat protein (TIGR03803 family)
MRISTSTLVAAFLAAGILTACGGGNNGLSSSMPSSVSRSLTAPDGVTEKVLYSFAGGSDGAHPLNEALIAANGAFYSSTERGGDSGCQSGDGCGTVFKMSTSGAESALYSFTGTPDGQYAKGGVVEKSGALFGTTQGGGKNSFGTFFKITTSGKETVLHSFGAAVKGGYDGIDPYGGVIYVQSDDTFYGTTLDGGTGTCGTSGAGCGTVFSVTPSGKETVLHSFAGGQDGDFPTGSLFYSNGKLYGTTEIGGGGGGSACTNSSGGPAGCGTIFSVSTSGKEQVLYSFTGGSDGAFPDGGLIDVNGALYGMAGGGGGKGCDGGCGTLFDISTSGKFHGIHSFQGPPNDGASPFGKLTNVKGTLYGTTQQGGKSTACTGTTGTAGCGVVFRVTTSGKETMLYSFEGGSDGATPITTLLYLNGVLYGTTYNGGSGSCSSGCGTVFSLSGF